MRRNELPNDLGLEDQPSVGAAEVAAIAADVAGKVNDAPTDGKSYVRKNGAWVEDLGGGGAVWGSISGTISAQSDLAGLLAGKQAAGSYVLDSDGRLSDSRPASDVSAWAKAVAKPTYTYSEVGAAPSSTVSFPGFGSTGSTACVGNDARLSDARTPTSHTLLGHTVSGLTTGHFLKALSATTFGFAAHGLTSSDVGAEPALGNPGTSGYVLSSTAAGVRSWVAAGGGSDPWTYVKLATDFTTSSSTAVDVTGLYFTPAINSQYEVEGTFFLRTATTTVGPRPGLAWPTSCTDGVASMWTTSSATAQLIANGNITAALLTAVGGLPTTTGSFPGFVQSTFITGASTSGNWKIQLASETAGTVVTMKAGSFIRYRKIP